MATLGSKALSTQVKKNLLSDKGLSETFEDAVIALYPVGTKPADADSGAVTPVGYITVDGDPFSFGSPTNALNFDSPDGASISKPAGVRWIFTANVVGTVGWGRLMGNATDNGAPSAVLPRVDFSVGTSNAQMYFPYPSVTAGQKVEITAFTIRMP